MVTSEASSHHNASPLNEDQSAVDVHGRAEEGRDVGRPGEDRRREAHHVLHHPAPDEGREAEQQRDPEPVPEHGHAVPFMPVVPSMLIVLGDGRRRVLIMESGGHVMRVWKGVMVIVRCR